MHLIIHIKLKIIIYIYIYTNTERMKHSGIRIFSKHSIK